MTTFRPTTTFRLAALAGLLALAGCGDSSLNPFSWFGRSEERVVLYPQGGFTENVDFRDLVEQVTALDVQQVIGGAVIRATGLPPRQGYWDGELTSDTDFLPDEKGVLELKFRIKPPAEPTDVNVPRSREVVVGVFVSRQKLAGVREIRVLGKTNSRVARR